LNDSIKNGSLNKNGNIKNYEVINFGCAGYSTGQEALQYELQAAKYKPDALVLVYNRGDSMESVIANKARKKAEPRPYFYIDQPGQVKEDDSVLAANFEKLKPNPAMNFLRKYSTVYGVLNQTDFSLTLNEPRYRKIKEWIASGVSKVNGMRADKSRPYGSNVSSSSIAVGVDGIDPRARRTRARKLRPYNNNDMTSVRMDRTRPYSKALYPDQDEMKVTKALIGKLASQAAKNGQVFVLVIYPNLDRYAALTDQAKQLKAMAEENHFLYLDLSPSFLSDPQPRSNFALYHFNKKGHITVANQLFQLFSRLL
jgi:hypothetical protein